MFKTKNILAFLSLIAGLVWLAVFYFPDVRLHLIFCDVGQGDAVLITKGFNQILIDGGPDDKVLGCLAKHMPFWDKKIEIIALTHPEADHLTGLISVLSKYETSYFFTGQKAGNSAEYKVLVSKTKITKIYAGDSIKLGEISLNTIWPEKGLTGQFNELSLVFLLKYRDKKVLLMGDADSKIQPRMTRLQETIDILKFPHHGSKTGMAEEFLKIIQPKIAVISVGKNSFGHPSSQTLELLTKYQTIIRRTDREGTLEFEF